MLRREIDVTYAIMVFVGHAKKPFPERFHGVLRVLHLVGLCTVNVSDFLEQS